MFRYGGHLHIYTHTQITHTHYTSHIYKSYTQICIIYTQIKTLKIRGLKPTQHPFFLSIRKNALIFSLLLSLMPRHLLAISHIQKTRSFIHWYDLQLQKAKTVLNYTSNIDTKGLNLPTGLPQLQMDEEMKSNQQLQLSDTFHNKHWTKSDIV